MCVGVTLWFGCGGVVSVCRLKPINIRFITYIRMSVLAPNDAAADVFRTGIFQ